MARRDSESSIEVRGADQLVRLVARLRAEGQGQIKRDLVKGLQVAAKPLIPVAKNAYRTKLPQRGGLAAFYARKPARVAVRSVSNPGVSIVFSKSDKRMEEQGRLFHPVFGRRPGVVQAVTPNIVGDALTGEADTVRDALVEQLRTVEDRLTRRPL